MSEINKTSSTSPQQAVVTPAKNKGQISKGQSHRIMLIPVGFGVGLTSVSLGLLHTCEQKGIKVGHFKPISQPSRNSIAKKDKTIDAISLSQNSRCISLSYFEEKMAKAARQSVQRMAEIGR